jgi:hypothetical protein
MEEEGMGVAVGMATKKPRISSSRPTAQTKKHTTGQNRQTMFEELQNLPIGLIGLITHGHSRNIEFCVMIIFVS